MTRYEKLITVPYLDGGLNTKYSPTDIPDNETADAKNVMFDEAGAVQTRYGFARVNSSPICSQAVDGFGVSNWDDGSTTMLVVGSGTLWAIQNTAAVAVSGSTGVFTAGVDVNMFQYQNIMFMCNGENIPYKYTDSEEFSRMGVYPPATAPTASSNGTGVVTGSISYKITNVNSQSVEGNPSTASTTFSVSGAQVKITMPIAPASYGVAARRIYRTEDGGSEWLRVAEVNNNTASFYTDNVSDASLTVTAPADNGVPPNWNSATEKFGRLFVNDPDNGSYVWYSEPDEPMTWGASNYQKFGEGDGQEVIGVAKQGDNLLVYKENAVYIYYMPDETPANWIVVKALSPYGTKSVHTICNYDNDQQFFLAVQHGVPVGFAAISGTAINKSATLLTTTNIESDLKSDIIEPDILDIPTAYLANWDVIDFENKLWIAGTWDSGSSANDLFYTYDYRRRTVPKQLGAWMMHDGSNIKPKRWAVYGGSLYFASSSDAYLYKYTDDTYNDDGDAINSYWWSAELCGDKKDTLFIKDFRALILVLEMCGQYHMDVRYKEGGVDGDGILKQIDLSTSQSEWGTMRWGIDTWAGDVSRERKMITLGNLRGESAQIRFSNQNTADQCFKVHRMSYGYNNIRTE